MAQRMYQSLGGHDQSIDLNGLSTHLPPTELVAFSEGLPGRVEGADANSPDQLDILRDIPTHVTGPHSHMSPVTQLSPRYPGEQPLDRFSREQGPWTLLNPSGTDEQGNISPPKPSSADYLYHPQAPYSLYRDQAPSEHETVGPSLLHSDSGYGSLTRHSVGHPSHAGSEHNYSVESHLISQLSDIHLPLEARNGAWSPPRAYISPATGSRLCSTCHGVLKNNAELNKHVLRHKKPFECNTPGCHRKEGFSSKKDLERHQESVHAARGTKYCCSLGDCPKKNKIWPRSDNFRQHLRRVHQRTVLADDEELKSFIYDPMDLDQNVDGDSTSVEVEHNSPPSVDWTRVTTRPEFFGLDVIGASHDDDVGASRQLRSISEEQPMDDDQLTLSPDEQAEEDEELGNNGMHDVSALRLKEDIPSETVLPSWNASGASPVEDQLPSALLAPSASGRSRASSLVSNHVSFSEALRGHQDDSEVINLVSESEEDAGSSGDPIQDGGKLGVAPQPLDDSEQMQQHAMSLLAAASAEPVHEFRREPSAELVQQHDSANTQLFSSRQSSSALFDMPDASELEQVLSRSASPSREQLQKLIVSDDEESVSGLLQKLLAKGELEKYLSPLGYFRGQGPGTDVPDTPGSMVKDTKFQCDQCHKTFERNCKLRKHLTRHEKPYSCTFMGCQQKFGSKSDWKRHEASRHFLLESWTCEEQRKDEPTKKCIYSCYRKETFKLHLEKEHTMTDRKMIKKKIDACRLGRDGASRFWCGFCRLTIAVNDTGLQASVARFNHIGDHFSGHNRVKQDISEWQHLPSETSNSARSSGTSSRTETTPEIITDLWPVEEGSGSKKRRQTSSSAERSSKRQRREEVWFCCSCSMQNNTDLSPSCADCSHRPCDSCLSEFL